MGLRRIIHRSVAGVLILAFVMSDLRAHAQGVALLPAPGMRVALSPVLTPSLLKGVKVFRDDPFRFDFILDGGDNAGTLHATSLHDDALRLVKYFLAALTVPEKDLWVNLSPYEKDRIVPEAFGQTEMGRDLLAQDYLLKQLTASLMYPEEGLGKKFWDEVYRQARARYGTIDIPVDTFNKVWIMPVRAVVYEKPRATGEQYPASAVGYVVESGLKVMLESDDIAAQHGQENLVRREEALPRPRETSSRALARQVIREVILPVLEKEVNEGRNFAPLRQVYNSLILAAWYKKKVLGVLGISPFGFYVDHNKVRGVTIDDLKEAEAIWGRYVEAFKKGAYNFIREEQDPVTQETIPRKYFAGGMRMQIDPAIVTAVDASQLALRQPLRVQVEVQGLSAEGEEVGGKVPDGLSIKPDSNGNVPDWKSYLAQLSVFGNDQGGRKFVAEHLKRLKFGEDDIFDEKTVLNFARKKALLERLFLLINILNMQRDGKQLFSIKQALRITSDHPLKILDEIRFISRQRAGSGGWLLNGSEIVQFVRIFDHREELVAYLSHRSGGKIGCWWLRDFRKWLRRDVIKENDRWGWEGRKSMIAAQLDIDVRDVKFLARQMLDDPREFLLYVDSSVADDEVLLKTLQDKEISPEDDVSFDRLTSSFSLKVREGGQRWLKDQFLHVISAQGTTETDPGITVPRAEHNPYGRIQFLKKLLSQKNARGGALFTASQALRAWWRPGHDADDLIEYLRGWVRDGVYLSDNAIRLCIYQRQYFNKASFEALWEKFNKRGFSFNMILRYVLNPFDVQNSLVEWDRKPVDAWSPVARIFRSRLVSLAAMDVSEVVFFLDQVLGVESGMSQATVDGLVEKDRVDLEYLRKEGPVDGMRMKSLSLSLSKDIRQQFQVLLCYWLKDYLYNGFVKDNPLFTEAAHNYIEHYQWFRSGSSLVKLARNLVMLRPHYKRYLAYLQLKPHVHTIMKKIAQGRSKKMSDHDIAVALRQQGYASVDVDVAFNPYVLSLDYVFPKGGSLLNLLSAEDQDPLEELMVEESREAEIPEVHIHVAGAVEAYVVRGARVADVLTEFLTAPGQAHLKAAVMAGEFSVKLDGMNIAVPGGLYSFLDPGKKHVLMIDAAEVSAAAATFPEGLTVDGKPGNDALRGLLQELVGINEPAAFYKKLLRLKFQGKDLDLKRARDIAGKSDRYARVLFLIELLGYTRQEGVALFDLYSALVLASSMEKDNRNRMPEQVNWFRGQKVLDDRQFFALLAGRKFNQARRVIDELHAEGWEASPMDGIRLVAYAFKIGHFGSDPWNEIKNRLKQQDMSVNVPKGLTVDPGTDGQVIDPEGFLKSLENTSQDAVLESLLRLRFQGKILDREELQRIVLEPDWYARILFFMALLGYKGIEGRPLFSIHQAAVLARSLLWFSREQALGRINWLLRQKMFDGYDIYTILRKKLFVKIRVITERLQQPGHDIPAFDSKMLIRFAMAPSPADGDYLTIIHQELEKKDNPALSVPEWLFIEPDESKGEVDVRLFLNGLKKSKDDKGVLVRQLLRISFRGEFLNPESAHEIVLRKDPYEQVLELIDLLRYEDPQGGSLFGLDQAVVLSRLYKAQSRKQLHDSIQWLIEKDLFEGGDIYRILKYRWTAKVRYMIARLTQDGREMSGLNGEILFKYIKARGPVNGDCLKRIKEELANKAESVVKSPAWITIKPGFNNSQVDVRDFVTSLRNVKDETVFAGELQRISVNGRSLELSSAKAMAHSPGRYARLIFLIDLLTCQDKMGGALFDLPEAAALAIRFKGYFRGWAPARIQWLLEQDVFDGHDIFHILASNWFKRVKLLVEGLKHDGQLYNGVDGKMLIKYAAASSSIDDGYLKKIKEELEPDENSWVEVPAWIGIEPGAGGDPVDVRGFIKNLKKIKDKDALAEALLRLTFLGEKLDAGSAREMAARSDPYEQVLLLIEFLKYRNNENNAESGPLFTFHQAVALAKTRSKGYGAQASLDIAWLQKNGITDGNDVFFILKDYLLLKIKVLVQFLETNGINPPYSGKTLISLARKPYHRDNVQEEYLNAVMKRQMALEAHRALGEKSLKVHRAPGKKVLKEPKAFVDKNAVVFDVLAEIPADLVAMRPGEGVPKEFLAKLKSVAGDKESFARQFARLEFLGKRVAEAPDAVALVASSGRYVRTRFLIRLLTRYNGMGRPLFDIGDAVALSGKLAMNKINKHFMQIDLLLRDGIFDGQDISHILAKGVFDEVQWLVKKLTHDKQHEYVWKLDELVGKVLLEYALRQNMRLEEMAWRIDEDLWRNKKHRLLHGDTTTGQPGHTTSRSVSADAAEDSDVEITIPEGLTIDGKSGADFIGGFLRELVNIKEPQLIAEQMERIGFHGASLDSKRAEYIASKKDFHQRVLFLIHVLTCRNNEGQGIFDLPQAATLGGLFGPGRRSKFDARVQWLLREGLFTNGNIFTILTQDLFEDIAYFMDELKSQYLLIDAKLVISHAALRGDAKERLRRLEEAAIVLRQRMNVPDVIPEGVVISPDPGGGTVNVRDFLRELKGIKDSVLFARQLKRMRFRGEALDSKAADKIACKSDKFERVLFLIELWKDFRQEKDFVLPFFQFAMDISLARQESIKDEIRWFLSKRRRDGLRFFEPYIIAKILLMTKKDTVLMHRIVDYFSAQESDGKVLFSPKDILLIVKKRNSFLPGELPAIWSRFWGRFEKKGVKPRFLLKCILYPHEVSGYFSRLMAGAQENVNSGRSDPGWLFKHNLVSETTLDVEDIKFLLGELSLSEGPAFSAYIDRSVEEDRLYLDDMKRQGPQDDMALRRTALSFDRTIRTESLHLIAKWVEEYDFWQYREYLKAGNESFVFFFLGNYRWSRMNAGWINLISEFKNVLNNIHAYAFWAGIKDDRLRSTVFLMNRFKKRGLGPDAIQERMQRKYLLSEISAARIYLARTPDRPLLFGDLRDQDRYFGIDSREEDDQWGGGEDQDGVAVSKGSVEARTVLEALKKYFSDPRQEKMANWFRTNFTSIFFEFNGVPYSLEERGHERLTAGGHQLVIYRDHEAADGEPQPMLSLWIDASQSVVPQPQAVTAVVKKPASNEAVEGAVIPDGLTLVPAVDGARDDFSEFLNKLPFSIQDRQQRKDGIAAQLRRILMDGERVFTDDIADFMARKTELRQRLLFLVWMLGVERDGSRLYTRQQAVKIIRNYSPKNEGILREEMDRLSHQRDSRGAWLFKSGGEIVQFVYEFPNRPAITEYLREHAGEGVNLWKLRVFFKLVRRRGADHEERWGWKERQSFVTAMPAIDIADAKWLARQMTIDVEDFESYADLSVAGDKGLLLLLEQGAVSFKDEALFDRLMNSFSRAVRQQAVSLLREHFLRVWREHGVTMDGVPAAQELDVVLSGKAMFLRYCVFTELLKDRGGRARVLGVEEAFKIAARMPSIGVMRESDARERTLRFIETVLSCRGQQGAYLFTAEQLLEAWWPVADDVGELIAYLQGWHRDGEGLNDAQVRFCVLWRKNFRKESFEALWNKFHPVGFSPPIILNYVVNRVNTRKIFMEWMEKPVTGWSDNARLLRRHLVKLARADVGDVAFFFRQVSSNDAEFFDRAIDQMLARDRADLEYLRKNGPVDDVKMRSLSMSLSADIRAQFRNYLYERLSVYFVRTSSFYNADAQEAVHIYLEHYRWSRANAGFTNLKMNIEVVCQHWERYLRWISFLPHIRTIINEIYKKRKAGEPEDSIVSYLNHKGYQPRDIETARSFYTISLDRRLPDQQGSLLDVIMTDEMDPLNELIKEEEKRAAPAEIKIKVGGLSYKTSGKSVGEVLGRFLAQPGMDFVIDMIKNGGGTAWLNQKEIKLPASLRLSLEPGHRYDLVIDTVPAVGGGDGSGNFPDDMARGTNDALSVRKKVSIVRTGEIADAAERVTPGGIDLGPGMRQVVAVPAGAAPAFQFDPAVVHQMDGMDGVRPLIIGMEPLENIAEFLGLPPVHAGLQK